MHDFLDERKKKIETFNKDIRKKTTIENTHEIPDGLFIKCQGCQETIYRKVLVEDMMVCPHCQYHFMISARHRMHLTVDPGSFHELFIDVKSVNPLKMKGYEEKLNKSRKHTGEDTAFLCGRATINDMKVNIGILDPQFMMGSMGSVVGEKVTRLIEDAIDEQRPLIIFSASGGARMQEGILSLMQMAKTSAALKMLDQKGLLFISVLTYPTTGGVAASFASLGDIMIAEEKALIGFAGSRVIKQTIRQDLPKGFQTDKFQLDHGQIDLIVHRRDMKQILSKLLSFHEENHL
jgi:acetyl-CoA carboxylase carboxyl transferase subunit beta